MDDGYEEGIEIPMYYDPMIAKLITYGDSREEAIHLMKGAIKNYKIEGIKTTLPFGAFVCEHESFTSGNFDTHFVADHFKPELLQKELTENEAKTAAIIASLVMEEQEGGHVAHTQSHPHTPMSAWRLRRS